MGRIREVVSRLFGGAPAPLGTPDRLIVGLGNPGAKYAATRHNAGFRVLECLARRHGADFREEPGLDARVAPVELAGTACLLVEPQTFMNRSGTTVLAAMGRWPSIDPPRDLLVVYDDMDLPLGRIRLRPAGGGGGHNGIGDVLEAVGHSEVQRLRFGIGHPGQADAVLDWVLQPFTPEEVGPLEAAVERAADAVEAVVAEGLTAAMGRFNAVS